MNQKAAIEAILFASGDSVEAARLAQALEITVKEAISAADALMADYQASDRGITIIKLDTAYQMVSVKEYAPQGVRSVYQDRYGSAQKHSAFSGGARGLGGRGI